MNTSLTSTTNSIYKLEYYNSFDTTDTEKLKLTLCESFNRRLGKLSFLPDQEKKNFFERAQLILTLNENVVRETRKLMLDIDEAITNFPLRKKTEHVPFQTPQNTGTLSESLQPVVIQSGAHATGMGNVSTKTLTPIRPIEPFSYEAKVVIHGPRIHSHSNFF